MSICKYVKYKKNKVNDESTCSSEIADFLVASPASAASCTSTKAILLYQQIQIHSYMELEAVLKNVKYLGGVNHFLFIIFFTRFHVCDFKTIKIVTIKIFCPVKCVVQCVVITSVISRTYWSKSGGRVRGRREREGGYSQEKVSRYLQLQ